MVILPRKNFKKKQNTKEEKYKNYSDYINQNWYTWKEQGIIIVLRYRM